MTALKIQALPIVSHTHSHTHSRWHKKWTRSNLRSLTKKWLVWPFWGFFAIFQLVFWDYCVFSLKSEKCMNAKTLAQKNETSSNHSSLQVATPKGGSYTIPTSWGSLKSSICANSRSLRARTRLTGSSPTCSYKYPGSLPVGDDRDDPIHRDTRKERLQRDVIPVRYNEIHTVVMDRVANSRVFKFSLLTFFYHNLTGFFAVFKTRFQF